MATNALGPYAEVEYASEALYTLRNRMGLANRVYIHGSDTTERRGNQITFAQPATFTATDVPDTGQQAVDPLDVTLTLAYQKGVEFGLTSKELSTSRQNIVDNHIIPAALATADIVDSTLATLYKDVPWYVTATGTPTDTTDVVGVHQALFDNKVPFDGNVHFMVNGERQAKFQNLLAFSQQQGSGAAGISTQMTGDLGQRFGMNFFANQNVQTHSTTALSSVTALQLNANAAAGATEIVVKDSDGTLTGTIAQGDTLEIAGNTQRYAVTAASTASGNLFTLSVTPPLAQAYSEDDVVTLAQPNAKKQNLAFHKNAFCLAFAKLTEMANGRGAQVSSMRDPQTGITLRVAIWSDSNADKMKFRVDTLFGVKTLNPNLAVRYES